MHRPLFQDMRLSTTATKDPKGSKRAKDCTDAERFEAPAAWKLNNCTFIDAHQPCGCGKLAIGFALGLSSDAENAKPTQEKKLQSPRTTWRYG